MSLLTIYRVEDVHTKGPYVHQPYRTARQAKASRALAHRHTDAFYIWDKSVLDAPEIHPGPDTDPGMRARWQFMDWSARQSSRNYNFGFTSIERLGQWFFGELDTLTKLNMRVAAYEVPHQAVIRGEWQAAFRRQSATLVTTMPLEGLVE
jgi:hypothetical protein